MERREPELLKMAPRHADIPYNKPKETDMRLPARAKARRAALRIRAKRGMTLIELMVASVVLLIAMAGIVPLFLTGLSQASSLRMRSVATNVAREKMEQIRQLDYRRSTPRP
jgi:prepilin-type N-terminal cleavage/methylation domain-containing protein